AHACSLSTDITGAESLYGPKLLQLKYDREAYRILCHWCTITSRRLKAPAPHCFYGGLVQIRVSCRAYHLDVFHSPLRRNAHLQQYGTLDPASPGRLGIARFDLIAPNGTGCGATAATTCSIARSSTSPRSCTAAGAYSSTGMRPPARGPFPAATSAWRHWHIAMGKQLPSARSRSRSSRLRRCLDWHSWGRRCPGQSMASTAQGFVAETWRRTGLGLALPWCRTRATLA